MEVFIWIDTETEKSKLTFPIRDDRMHMSEYAGMTKLVNVLDLGSSASACGFESHYPYHPK